MNTKALRQKVLDLAIHGKLVPQNPNDESATVLLEKIRAEKAEKIKKGELKADKKDSFIFVGSDKRHYEQFADGTVKDIEDEIPFDLPKNWAWCRLKEIISINPRNKLDENLEVSFIPMTYIDADYKNTHKQEKRVWKEIKTGFTHFAENDVAIAKISPCFENRKSVILHNLINGYGAGTTELFILRTTSVITSEYLLWIVKTDDFINAGVGNFSGVVGQQRLAKDVVENYLIPLPPFEEQQRIVSSINDAFSQINLIENNSTDLQTAIKQAKSKILDLAIHGKLVPQDPTDEPAEELLKRIATSDNRPYKKFEEEIPFDIPESWAWSSMKDIVTINPKNKLDDNLQVSFIPMTLIDAEYKNTHGQEERLWKDIKKGFTHFAENDVAIAKISPCFENRKSVVLKNLKNGYGAGTTELYILRSYGAVLPEYIMWLAKSDNFINTGVGNFSGVVGQQRLARDIVEDYPVPLPPLTEQQRIVTKIEELFSYLDTISSNLE